MTLTEAQAMTPEEKRVKLAEHMGYTNIGPGSNYDTQRRMYGTPPGDEYRKPLPDYCNDLNVVHEVEKTLGLEERERYYAHLGNVSGWLTICASR